MAAVNAGVRAPTQKRARESWDRLLDAGAEMVFQRGWDGFTVQELAQFAGVSNGAIYYRVANRDALMGAIRERMLARIREDHQLTFERSEDWDGLEAQDTLRQLVTRTADLLSRHRDPLRALVSHIAIDEVLIAHGTEAILELSQLFRMRLLPALESLGGPSPELTGRSIFRIVHGTLITWLSWPEHEAEPRVSWTDLVSDLTEMVVDFCEVASHHGQ